MTEGPDIGRPKDAGLVVMDVLLTPSYSGKPSGAVILKSEDASPPKRATRTGYSEHVLKRAAEMGKTLPPYPSPRDAAARPVIPNLSGAVIVRDGNHPNAVRKNGVVVAYLEIIAAHKLPSAEP
jgi:hypothetical protein